MSIAKTMSLMIADLLRGSPMQLGALVAAAVFAVLALLFATRSVYEWEAKWPLTFVSMLLCVGSYGLHSYLRARDFDAARAELGKETAFKDIDSRCTPSEKSAEILVCRVATRPECKHVQHCAFDPNRWTKQATTIGTRTPRRLACPQAADQNVGHLDRSMSYGKPAAYRLSDELLRHGVMRKGIFAVSLTPAMVRASLDLALEREAISQEEHGERLEKARKALFSSPVRSIAIIHSYQQPVFLFGSEPLIKSEFQGSGTLVYMSPELATGLSRERLAVLSFEDRVCSNDTSFDVPLSWSTIEEANSSEFFRTTFRFLPTSRTAKEEVLAFLEAAGVEQLNAHNSANKPLDLVEIGKRDSIAAVLLESQRDTASERPTSPGLVYWDGFSKFATVLSFALNCAKLVALLP